MVHQRYSDDYENMLIPKEQMYTTRQTKYFLKMIKLLLMLRQFI